MHACIGKDQNFFPIFLKHEKRKQEVFKWCDIDSKLQTAEPTGSAKCSDFFHNLTPASPDVQRACHDSVRVTGTFVYRRLCWRFVVMTVPFTQEIKFKHLRNNSQLDKYLCIDIVKDLSAEFNYSNLKLWPRDVILIEISAAARRVIKLKPVLFILHTFMIYHSKPITTLNFLSH